MSCMCGDTQCPSCGPAQGNFRCPICRAWADDGCEHFEEFCKTCGTVIVNGDEETGEICGAHGHDTEIRLKPEFQAQADDIAKAEAEAEEQLARDLADDEDYVRSLEEE